MRFFRNIQLKLLAIMFAMLVWIHVATNQRYDLEISYKLSYVNIPETLGLAEAPPDQVAVMMRGSGKGLMRLMWGERRWPIDLTRAKAGRQQVHLLAANVPLYGIKDLEVLDLVDEDTVTVTLDSLAQRKVPIRSAVEIETSGGFVRATPPILTPDSAVLTGPFASLESIEEVWTQPDLIKNVTEPVERVLPLLPFKLYGVTSSVDQIRLYQKVEPFLTREFDAVPVQAQGGHETDELEISPSHVSVEIAGPQSAVLQLVADSIAVTCTPHFLKDARVTVLATAVVSEPLQVLKLSPDSVTVERHERSRADTGN